MGAQALISNLAARGITLTPNGDSLIARPRERLTDADREAIRQRKAGLLALLREQAETDRIARLDAERREADHQAKRGYDFDPSAPSHAEREEAEIDRLAKADGWPLSSARHPAHSIVATCQRYGVALRIDATTGDLVVGRAGAKAEEATQPWPSLLGAIEAHLEAVASLVEAGWMLKTEFPQTDIA